MKTEIQSIKKIGALSSRELIEHIASEPQTGTPEWLCQHWLQENESPFVAGTGLMGGTEPGQEVTEENAHHLPPGSVVRCDSGGRLIHLHDNLWLYCSDGCWCYDRISSMDRYLPGILCHLPT